MRSIRPSRGGFALAIVLWIVAALLAGIAFLVAASKENVAMTAGLDDKLRAVLEAQDVFEVLKFYIMTADYDKRALYNSYEGRGYRFPPKIVLDGRDYNLSDTVTVSLQDVSSLIDVFYPKSALIAGMVTESGERELFYTVRDSVKDWADPDNVVSLNGAEEAYYRLKKRVGYGPRNSPALQSVDELHLINGIDRLSSARWDALRNDFYYGSGSLPNLALADERYLSKLLGLDRSEARALTALRETDLEKFVKAVEKLNGYDEDSMGFTLSFTIRLRVTVQLPDAASKLRATVGFRSGAKKGYTVTDYALD